MISLTRLTQYHLYNSYRLCYEHIAHVMMCSVHCVRCSKINDVAVGTKSIRFYVGECVCSSVLFSLKCMYENVCLHIVASTMLKLIVKFLASVRKRMRCVISRKVYQCKLQRLIFS